MTYYVNQDGLVCETTNLDIVKDGFVDVVLDTDEVEDTFVAYEFLDDILVATGKRLVFKSLQRG